jgi:26S proteasome regulatory subunit N11
MYKGLGKYYYSININYKTNELEQKMLLNLYKEKWTSGMTILPPNELSEKTCSNIESMGKLAVEYAKRIDEETKKVIN